MRINRIWIVLSTALVLAGCGGGSSSSTPPSASSPSSNTSNSSSSSGAGASSTSSSSSSGAAASNSIAVVVNKGPAGQNGTINIAYASATVCEPNGGKCATINNLQVDTGSVGLRIFASVLKSAGLSLTDANADDPANPSNTVAECLVFADGYIWGPVSTATVQMAGETASNLPIQIIDDASSYTDAPSVCKQSGNNTSLNTVPLLFANGVLGIGLYPEDCGPNCAQCDAFDGGCTTTTDIYYSCSAGTSGSCALTTYATAAQVANPISLFAADNNGSVLYLPLISYSGQATATGTLTFGIGTQTNNELPGTATVLTTDQQGLFTTTATFLVTHSNPLGISDGFFDSGSNAYYFDDTQLPACNNNNTSFYCPASTTSLMVTDQGRDYSTGLVTGNTSSVPLEVANFNSVTSNRDLAYNDVAGGAGNTLSGDFDFGLPFFYSRHVFTGIAGTAAVGVSGLSGPYFAY